MRKQVLTLAVAALAGMLVVSCGAGEAKELAESKAVPEFHARYDRQDFTAIYVDATKEFRDAMAKPNYDEFMKAVRRKLGPVKSATRQNWNVNAGTGGTIIVLTYAVEWEQGSGTETFTFVRRGGVPKLMGYNVNSNTLITK